MKYVGTYSDPKDIVTKDKLEAVASRVSTNEDNIAMAESDIDRLQTTVGTLQTNVNNVQTALTSKQDKVVGGASTITKDNLTANRALVSNSSGKVAVSTVTSTELGYLDGVTSNVQTQLNKKLEKAPVTSVNSKTGAVQLNASDVGALPDTTVIPTVNNATLTIRRNSIDVGSFTANSAEDVNIDINVPTDKSDIGLGNVDNVKQYSATNPPPYPVTSVNGAIGDVKSTFYVTVTQGNGNTATADKTAEEVYEAYAAGYAVYAIANLRGYDVPTILPMSTVVKDFDQVALGFVALTGPRFVFVQCNGSAWAVITGMLASREDIPTVPEYLPNPNALNIKIGDTTTSYDGSAAKTVEIPEGVPSVTTSDNGKFLRVVNGAWAAVAIADASGVKF